MINDVKKRIEKAISNVRIGLMAKISSVLKKEGEVFVKLSEEDEIRDVKIISPYGFSSLPKNGIFGQIIFNNTGKKASLIGVEDRDGKPLQLEVGEVLIYKPGTQTYIHLKNDNKIYVKGKVDFDDGKVKIENGVITVNGGTKDVARVGDSIEVVVNGTTYTGTIKTGTSNIKA